MQGDRIGFKTGSIPLFVQDIGITDISENIPVQVMLFVRVIGIILNAFGIFYQVGPQVE